MSQSRQESIVEEMGILNRYTAELTKELTVGADCETIVRACNVLTWISEKFTELNNQFAATCKVQDGE